jgi:hypothetical protein
MIDSPKGVTIYVACENIREHKEKLKKTLIYAFSRS